VSDDIDAHYFLSCGCEYYATARWAMSAQRSWVCGNLFHHAVETILKAGLAKNAKTLAELQRMGHKLKELWRAYKAGYPNVDLTRHDKTIDRLDRFEEIRYPNTALNSIGVSMQWSGEPLDVKAHGELKAPRLYVIVVSDIDDLVADLLKTSSWNLGVVMGSNQAALEAIKRENRHADFLTTVIQHGDAPP